MKTEKQNTFEAFKSVNATWKTEPEIMKCVRQIERIKLAGRVDLLPKFQSKLNEILKNFDLKIENNCLVFPSGYSVSLKNLN